MCAIGKSNHWEAEKLQQIEEQFEKLSMNLDSGAVDHVMGESEAQMFQTVPSPMSKMRKYYHSANKGKIYNKGQKDITALTEKGTQVEMTFQLGENIGQPLVSVRRLRESGNLVVFNDELEVARSVSGSLRGCPPPVLGHTPLPRRNLDVLALQRAFVGTRVSSLQRLAC